MSSSTVSTLAERAKRIDEAAELVAQASAIIEKETNGTNGDLLLLVYMLRARLRTWAADNRNLAKQLEGWL